VLDGYSAVDESMLIGESLPVEKTGAGIGGDNKTGAFRFRRSKVGKDTALAQIIDLVENAQSASSISSQTVAATSSGAHPRPRRVRLWFSRVSGFFDPYSSFLRSSFTLGSIVFGFSCY
jgi:Cu+-exporting ATPase